MQFSQTSPRGRPASLVYSLRFAGAVDAEALRQEEQA